jgi:hypothetical protein
MRRASAAVVSAVAFLAMGAACTLLYPLDDLSGGPRALTVETPDASTGGSAGGEQDAANDTAVMAEGSGGTGGTVADGASAGSAGAPPTYGVIDTVAFATDFLLDGEKLQDSSYLQQHEKAIQMSAAFWGTYTSKPKPIPPAAATSTATLGVHLAADAGAFASVHVVQQSMSASGAVSPYVQLQFNTDQLAVGATKLPQDAILVVWEVVGEAPTCVAAIGFGAVTIQVAQATAELEGGKLKLGGSGIALYHPSATPAGDMTSVLGVSVCAKQ